jgi:nucleoporin GLE1
MAPTSFPGVSSSPPSNSNNDNTEDKMEDYERRWRERNSEETHKTALAAALARHNEIRERALGILEIEQLREETEMLRQKRIQTEERVKLETRRAMEQLRIREEENKARQIPQPPPRVPTPPPAIPASVPQPKQPDNAPTSASQQAKQPPPAPAPLQHSSSNAPRTSQTKDTPQSTFQQHLNQPNAFQPTQNQPLASQPSKIQPAISNTMQKQAEAPANQPNQNPQLAQAQAPATTGPQHPQNPSHTPQAGEKSSAQTQKPHTLHESVDRYLTIHKNLKEVRQAIKERGEKDAQFKKKAGEMRRAITRSVGQLTGERGANKVPVSALHSPLASRGRLNPHRPKLLSHNLKPPWAFLPSTKLFTVNHIPQN